MVSIECVGKCMDVLICDLMDIIVIESGYLLIECVLYWVVVLLIEVLEVIVLFVVEKGLCVEWCVMLFVDGLVIVCDCGCVL